MTVVSDFTALLTINDTQSARWNGLTDLATPVIVTYSFADGDNVPTISESALSVTGTSAFTEAQRENFRAVTGIFEAAAGTIFVEVEEGGMVDLSNAHGSSAGGWAYLAASTVNMTGAGILVIDDDGDYDPGSHGFGTMLHELGHSMGLQHPHEGSVTLDPTLDKMSNTVMTYNHSTHVATGLGPLDIQALQHLYGASIDTSGWILRFDESTKVLNVLGDSADNVILGARGNNHLDGGAGRDLIIGREDNDTLAGGAGDDTINGGNGTDTLVLSGTKEEYSFSFDTADLTTKSITHIATGEVDVISSIEKFQFQDKLETFDETYAFTDLAITPAYYFGNFNVTQGQSISKQIYVNNSGGTVDAANVTVHAYLSKDDVFDETDVQVGSLDFASIAANKTAYEYGNINLTAPETLDAGEYRLFYVIDPENKFREWDEGNNNFLVLDTVNVEEARADLGFYGQPSPKSSQLVQGESTTAVILVDNGNGTKDANDVTVYAYLSADQTMDTTDVKVGSYTFASIPAGNVAAGGYQHATITLTPPDSLAQGDYYIIYSVDPLNAIEERNETNNIAVVADTLYFSNPEPTQSQTSPEVSVNGNGLNIADGDTTPDIGDQTDFGTMAAGGPEITRTFTVTNEGDADLMLDNLSLPQGFTLVDSLDGTLAPGGSQSFDVRLTASVAGTYAGDIQFETNDVDESTFTFAISGLVTDPVQPVENQAPTAVTLDSSAIAENATAKTVVGTLSASDPNTDDSHSFSLIDDANGMFTLDGDALVVAQKANIDFETAQSHSIIVRATDKDGLSVDQTLTITVNDLHESSFDQRATTAKGTAPVDLSAIRDFDGNDLGDAAGWKLIGQADVQFDGDAEFIYVNSTNGRWATVGPNENGIVDFTSHGAGGETRVVGIYIDPEVEAGNVVRGSDFDSQQRFQKDLLADNLTVIDAYDFDGDGAQEIYFKVNDGSAYLRALMHSDGNIQYANYQSTEQVEDYLTGLGFEQSVLDTILL